MTAKEITAERLREVLHYDPKTGVFTWLKCTGRWRPGMAAGSICDLGYVAIKIGGVSRKAHRLAWLWVHGKWPEKELDHIDGNRANNAMHNLREVTRTEQLQNQRHARRDNSAGVLGAFKSGRKFISAITLKGRRRYLGTFSTAQEAHAAYIAAKRQLHPFGTL